MQLLLGEIRQIIVWRNYVATVLVSILLSLSRSDHSPNRKCRIQIRTQRNLR